MKLLLIKTSSMGDVIHTLPAISDACANIKNLKIDWVVEKDFIDIAKMHPGIHRVIPVALRAWRKNIFKTFLSQEWKQFKNDLRANEYDIVLDAQGLLKSAFLTRMARGKRVGLDRHSAWEPLASLAYQEKIAIDPKQHAIERVRELFAKTFNYCFQPDIIDYGISALNFEKPAYQDYVMFIHSASWETKCWPETHWIELAKKIQQPILLPWGNEVEKQRAERIAAQTKHAIVLPKLSISKLASYIAHAKACVAVDTGLGHLAAACGTPCISLYGPTKPSEIGTRGANQVHLSAGFDCSRCSERDCKREAAVRPACLAQITADEVFKHLQEFL